MDQQQKLVAFTGLREELKKLGVQNAYTVVQHLVDLGFEQLKTYLKKIQEQVWMPSDSEINRFVDDHNPAHIAYLEAAGYSHRTSRVLQDGPGMFLEGWREKGVNYSGQLRPADLDWYKQFAAARVLLAVEQLQRPSTQSEINELFNDLLRFLYYKRRLHDGK